MPDTSTNRGTASATTLSGCVNDAATATTAAPAETTRSANSSCLGEKRPRSRWLTWVDASMPAALMVKRMLNAVGVRPPTSWNTRETPVR